MYRIIAAAPAIIAAFAIAFGGIVGNGFESQASASQVGLRVGVSNPTMLAGEKESNMVRITLSGFELPNSQKRPPVNVAIVIDVSGSMSGKKIEQARDAAVAAVNRLRKDDIVSVVLYASSAEVLVPATKATDRQQIIKKIKSISAGGSTALFAGVSKGAAEVRKFIDSDSVNRVILLSDGRANVGPKTPRELERLGRSLVKEGISVTTLGLGLGYNEDLMSRLATAGSGNHLFVEEADDLIAVFNGEFNDLMSVVASDFSIHARLAKGVRPVRVLGTKVDISGQDVHIPLAQLYSNQERYFVLEVEVDAGKANTSQSLVTVSVEYQNMITETTDKLSSSASVRFSNDIAKVKEDRDVETFAFCAIQLANERNCRATELRDAGQIEEAKKLLIFNGKSLSEAALICKDYDVEVALPKLDRNARLNYYQASEIDKEGWARTRKVMRAEQAGNTTQQTYRAPDGKR